MNRGEAITKEDLRVQLGEALHTGFRKAIPDTPEAEIIHEKIRQMSSNEWADYLDWVVDSLTPSFRRGVT